MHQKIAELLHALDLERIERNIFRGIVPKQGRQRVFGGLVVAQALVAASRTVEERAPHSLHAYFILPGDPQSPIVYEVERVRDGRSFSTRRCIAVQDGRTIFDLFASFHVEEEGLEHQAEMPAVPPPDQLPSQADIFARFGNSVPAGLKAWFDAEQAIEIRPCDFDRYDPSRPALARQAFWIKIACALPDDPAIHRAVLAYVSDMTLIDATLAVHRRSLFEPDFAAASLDHALWFHRPLRADDWLLYAQDSPNMKGSRGLARGLFFDGSGNLVASVAQEGLIRMRQPR